MNNIIDNNLKYISMEKLKKVFYYIKAIILIIVLIACTPELSKGQSVTANYNSSSLIGGDPISVPIVLNSGAANIGGFELYFNYNTDVLTYTGYTIVDSRLLSNSSWTAPTTYGANSNYKVFMGWGYNLSPYYLNFSNQTLLYLNFIYHGGSTTIDFYTNTDPNYGASYLADENTEFLLPNSWYISGSASGAKVPVTSTVAGGLWNSASTWIQGNVPNTTANTEIFIGSTTSPVVIDNNLTLPLNLTINSGTGLTLNSGQTMDVNGKAFTIKSGGSFVNKGTVNGNATVEFFLAGTGNRDTIWHLYSSPVNNSPVEVFDHFYVYYWNAAGEQYVDLYNGDYLENQRGYVCFNTANISSHPDITLSFSGTLNNGDQTPVSLAWPHNPGNTEQNWNLIGNPFTSAVDVDLLTYSGVDPTIYYYIGNGGNYATYNRTTYATTNGGQDKVPAIQGFWVRTNAASPSVTFTNASRVHSTQPFYKELITKTSYLSLFADANGFSDETVIAFYNGATGNFESDFDAVKMAGFYNDVPSFYSMGTDNSNLAVNGISEPELNQSISIPLSFVLGINANSVIRAEGMNTFGNDISFRLEDLVAQQIIDLRANSSYSFNYLQGGNQNRFVLHISKSANGIEENASDVDTYFWNNSLYINNAPNAEVVICNLLGQELMKRNISNTTSEKINLSGYTTGYYIVKIFDGNQISTKKVYIQ